MKANDIYKSLLSLFPEIAVHVYKYDKIGSRTIRLKFTDRPDLIFMYYSPNNWTLGTKVWRRKPVVKKIFDKHLSSYPLKDVDELIKDMDPDGSICDRLNELGLKNRIRANIEIGKAYKEGLLAGFSQK